MKVTASDLLAILRRFNVTDGDAVPRHIDQIAQSHPSPINTLVRFRFRRTYYFALFDDTAEDDSTYIIKQVQKGESGIEGTVLENPTSELATYGLPFKGKDVYLFLSTTGKKRLDSLLAERHPEVSRSTWQKHIKAGNIHVNGTLAKNAKQEVTEADAIAISIPDGADHSKLDLPIMYLDDDVIVINKPAGVLTHSKGAMNDEFTVADFFRRYTSVGLDTTRPGIVHRLDRDTSGIMIGARTPEAYALLKAQFADRKAKKTYVAIVQGTLSQPKATIDIPIGRNPSAPSTFRADSKGKAAQTDYVVVGTHGGQSLLVLQPHTGRTHQLRVHLGHLGVPIVGDRVYGTPSDRLYLHAYRLELTTAAGTRQSFLAPLPDEFEHLFPGAQHDVVNL